MPLYRCDLFPFRASLLDGSGTAEEDEGPIAAALRTYLARPDAALLPDTGWWRLGADDDFAELMVNDPALAQDREGEVITLTVELGTYGTGPPRWTVSSWNWCRPELVLPPGVGPADWVPDPAAGPPDARTRSFTAFVTERSCASGQPSVGRVIGPSVLVEDEHVLIAFGVRARSGAQTCPGNPSTPAAVDLGEPLGDRVLIDAGHLPYTDVRLTDPRR